MFDNWVIFFVFTVGTFVSTNAEASSVNQYHGRILKINGKYETIIGLADSFSTEHDGTMNEPVATGYFDQTYNLTGWSILEIKTSQNFSNIDQAYAAGLLEGRFTQELTALHWQNSLGDFCVQQKDSCSKLKSFFEIQLNWIYTQIDSNPNDEYWHQINLLLVQLNGLIDGNQNKTYGPRKELNDTLGLFLFQEIPSLWDILAHLGLRNFSHQDHCSALIKILPDNRDVFVAHTNWAEYSSMLRIIKRYTMPLTRTPTSTSSIVPNYDVILSGYPGTLQSIDDFYMTRPTNLTVLETTIDIYNDDLYKNIQPQSVPEWMRITVANRLANTGREWVDKFFKYNDGTYNNEWMIVDFKQFTPGQPPKQGFLTVAEQMTIYNLSVDMTATLNANSYWASYNNIYFPDFRNISGEEQRAKTREPELYSWYNSSRARIFRRDHHNVVDLPTMMHMMRYNDFQHDELSKCNCTPPYSAKLAIAARGDLNDKNGTYPDMKLGFWCGGATDVKITGYELMQNFSLVAISGPTTDQQKPFVWSESYCGEIAPHFGQPNSWNFGPITPSWTFP